MKKIKQLQKIKEVYANGGNIIQYLKSINGNQSTNTIEDIMISYDFQAGSYIKQLSENPNPEEENTNKTKKEDIHSKTKKTNSKNVKSKADATIKDAGTTNLGALLKAKLDDKN